MTIRSLAAEAIKVSDSDGKATMLSLSGRDRAVPGEGSRPVALLRPGLLALLLI